MEVVVFDICIDSVVTIIFMFKGVFNACNNCR